MLASPPPGRRQPTAAGPWCGHRELLGREDVMGLDDPGGVIGKLQGPVRVELRIPCRDDERLGGEDVVRGLRHRGRMIANFAHR
jgi:hypothetical protein